MQNSPAKAGKNQFKCYHCRLIFASKDGAWCDWDQMQVHLCRTCNKSTEKKTERSYTKS